MKTRFTFGMIVAGALLLTGFSPSESTAQPRPQQPNVRRPATPVIQQFPQAMPSSIQQTMNNYMMNEWSKRAALNSMLQPRIYIQPYPVYPVNPWYMYGNNPFMINPYLR